MKIREIYKFIRTLNESSSSKKWINEIKNESHKDDVDYEDALKLFEKLDEKEQFFVSPRGSYIDSPKIVFRLGEWDEEKLMGFIDVYCFDEKEKEGFIILAVDPEYRGRGVAKKLISKAIKESRKMGFNSLVYEVDKINKSSINLIKKFSEKFEKEPSEKDDKTYIFKYSLN